MRDDFLAMKAHRQQTHADWKQRNTAILNESGLSFKSVNYGESLVFREAGKPKVDFFPSTGRWRIPDKNQTFRGGAEAFLSWYAKQTAA